MNNEIPKTLGQHNAHVSSIITDVEEVKAYIETVPKHHREDVLSHARTHYKIRRRAGK